MFKLPEELDFFTRKVEVAMPVGNKTYKSAFIGKFNYISQDQFWEIQDLFNQAAMTDDTDEKRRAEEKILDDVLAGFDEISVGDRVLDDSNPEDMDWVLRSGKGSHWLRKALVRVFLDSYLDIESAVSKTGNSSRRRSTGRA